MQELLGLWNKLQERVSFIVTALQDAALLSHQEQEHGFSDTSMFAPLSKKQLAKRRSRASQISEESYDIVTELLTDVLDKRIGWRVREKDQMYRQLPLLHRPISPVPMPRPERPFDTIESLRPVLAASAMASSSKKLFVPNSIQDNRKHDKKHRKITAPTAPTDDEVETAGLDAENSFVDPAMEVETNVLAKLIEVLADWKTAFLKAHPVSEEAADEARTHTVAVPTKDVEMTAVPEGPSARKKAKFIVVGK
jgi:hypothetical protein